MCKDKVEFNKTDERTIEHERVISQMLQQKVSAFQKQGKALGFCSVECILYLPAKSSHAVCKVRIAMAVSARNTILYAYMRALTKI
jgi:hypothetical protein